MKDTLCRQFKAAWRAGVICALLFAVASCGTMGGKKNDEKNLLLSINAFNSAFRWEDYRQAASWLDPPLQEEFWRLADSLQGRMRVMDYEVRSLTLHDNGLTGQALLRYRFYYTNDPHIQSKLLHQQWHYLEKEKVWQLTQYDLKALAPSRP